MKRGIGKRGVSGVVTAILLILLAIAAVIIVWQVIKPLISNKGTDTNVLNVNLKIEKAEIQGNTAYVTIKREPGAGNVANIKIVLSNEIGDEQPFNTGVGLSELETHKFTLPPLNIENPTKVEVYPVLIKDGKEVIGIKETKSISGGEAAECATSTECQETPDDLCTIDTCAGGSCSRDPKCNLPNPYCDLGSCYECLDNSNCGTGEFCDTDKTCKPIPPTCIDGIKNGLETDIDCGGANCPTCANGESCLIPADCQSANCVAGTCQPASSTENCYDGIDNNGINGIDCNDVGCTAPAHFAYCGALVAQYSFEDNVNDLSGNGYNGVWSGTGTHYVTGGKYGKAGNFNGINDYVKIGGDDTFKSLTQGTIAGWVKSDLAKTNTFFGVGPATANSMGLSFWISIGTDGSLSIRQRNADSTTNNIWATLPATTFAANTPYYLTWTVDSTGNSFYINGIKQTTLSYSGGSATSNFFFDDIATTQNYWIGGRKYSSTTVNNFGYGLIDDVRIYSRALSQTEISQLASS